MPPACVAVAEHAGWSAERLLDAALAGCGFERLAAPRGQLRTTILLDLGAFERDSPALASRALVEHLIDRLSEAGWRRIAIASSADSSSTFLDNRSVPALADLFGYAYETARGTPYDVLDLSEDLADAPFPAGCALAGTALSRSWLESDLRIVVAKAATDLPEGIVLAAHALLAALPEQDKDYHYGLHAETAEIADLLLDAAPISLALIDGIGVPDGSRGRTAPGAGASAFVVAGTDLFAVDCVAAGKLGADPALSPLLRGLLARRGRPAIGQLDGPAEAVPGLRLPDPVLLESARQRDASFPFSRLVEPWLQRVDTSLFPFRNPVDAKLNSQLAHRFEDPDSDPAGRQALILANAACAVLGRMLLAWRVNFDKDSVERRLAGVSPETLACAAADYDAMQDELEDLQRWLAAPPAESDGESLYWRELGGATVFRSGRRFALPFDSFVARVDVARSIQYMNDYLGGTIQVLERDAQGRPLRQVERNLYLPQPNYLAWWGAVPIDVSKIERVAYEPDCHRMLWKTVKSENASAQFDDGIIEFRRGDGDTLVSVFGRQRFALPPGMDRAALDLLPQLKAQLVEHAYRQFFARTFSNFEALCEGREIRVGRPFQLPAHPDGAGERPIDALGASLAALAGLLGPWLQRVLAGPPAAGAGTLVRKDEQGYSHYQAAPPGGAVAAPPARDALAQWLHDFWSGYVEAVARDLRSSLQAPGREACTHS
jgi:uncharacterized protein (DUF362 family)